MLLLLRLHRISNKQYSFIHFYAVAIWLYFEPPALSHARALSGRRFGRRRIHSTRGGFIIIYIYIYI